MIKYNHSLRVLVIEDNAGDFMIVEDFLTDKILSPQIRHAENLKQASAILNTEECPFDVILLDLTLPDSSAHELITKILAASYTCPVIVLTGYADIDFSIKSISMGIEDYLIKDELSAAILYKSIIYAIERKNAIRQLEESKKNYSDLFHLSPQPMMVYDLDSLRFLNVNNAAIKNYGYTEDEFLNMTIKDIMPPEDTATVLEVIDSIKKNNTPLRKGLYKHKKKNNEIMQVEAYSSTFDDQKSRLVVINDVTERIQYYNAIEEQNKKLQEIAWIQSHIVRAPLARIMGIMSILKNLDPASKEFSDWISHLVASGNELDEIIHDIVNKTEQVKLDSEKQQQSA